MSLRAPAWERRYSRKLLYSDIAVVVVSVFGAQLLRFGLSTRDLQVQFAGRADFFLSYTLLSLGICVAWLAALSLFDTRVSQVFGTGPDEYKRVIHATFATFGLLAIIAFTFQSKIGRGYLLIALPAGLILLLVMRWVWRKRLHMQRRRGKNSYRTLLLGERHKCAHLAEQLRRNAVAGYEMVGAVTEYGTNREILPGVPVLADYDHLLPTIDEYDIDTLMVTGADTITPQHLRNIGWELEQRKIDLIVAASLTDVAGPRIHTRPVSGMPLLHVDFPEFSGRKFFAKRMFDLFGSGALLLVLSPVFLVIALLVRFDDPGPVFFRQTRNGLNGHPFKMLKFRSMIVNAEDRLPGLLDASEGNGVLFKMKDDPRITRIGRVLRKYSLDELPQLINVLKGEMSLVGPRPPLPQEVEQYEDWVHRRLLVKPGITGLWQVSGRSDLSWEDSVRLDLYYVENWSMTGDLLILWRTVKTVVRPEGAY